METLRQHLQSSWPGFSPFIDSHVLRLIARGRLRQAYRTKLETIADHERRLVRYRNEAITQIHWNRIYSFEREMERLRVERDIIKAAMDFLGIAP